MWTFIAAGVFALSSLITGFVGSVFDTGDTLGALPSAPAVFETSLQDRITAADTSMTLVSVTTRGGGTLSGYNCFTIDEGRTDMEYVCGTASGTAVTSLERGIDPLTGTSSNSTLKFAHRKGANVKVTDFPLVQRIKHILSGEYAVSFTPNENTDLVTKTYVDALALGISTIAASLTDDGLVELATGLEAASSTPTGASGATLSLHTGISTSTAPASGHVIPVTGSDGNLDAGFLGNFASTTTFQVGDTPLLSIGKYIWASTTAGTSTWSVPSGVKRIKVTVIGGGGNGGGSSSGSPGSGGGGGGGGGTSIKWYDVSATSTLQFHVGAVGEYSWFGGTYSSPVVKANAGADAAADTNGGNGGTATGGDLNFTGGDGVSGPTSEELGGNGGSSLFGMGGGGAENNNTSGKNGKSIGGGGGGGADGGGGGAGAAGGIIIEY